MRLLRLEDDGEFSLVEYVGNNVPRYAILSHTWGSEDEEVTFKDLMDDMGRTKAGYRKIRFCGKQAANDGLRFFWVDTCCIDKSSSAELSEAINSMFRWYQNAARCYVYLSDVSLAGSIGSDPLSRRRHNPAFQQSRWFTRGWTLQELVAPTCVEFFSVEGERLGGKPTMMQEIHEITGISVQALQGNPLSGFGVDERMSWAARRETKREEDAAYCLLGIFDIHMPLIYGEGRRKAFMRLRKAVDESLRDESHALPPALSTHQPKRRHDDVRETQRDQQNVVCFKCLYFRYLTKNGKGRADGHSPGGELGHYANEPHCYKCGEYGHLANDLHCYKCGEHGHYADESHCYRCNIRGHFVSDCPL